LNEVNIDDNSLVFFLGSNKEIEAEDTPEGVSANIVDFIFHIYQPAWYDGH
jgi:hypothetical protein